MVAKAHKEDSGVENFGAQKTFLIENSFWVTFYNKVNNTISFFPPGMRLYCACTTSQGQVLCSVSPEGAFVYSGVQTFSYHRKLVLDPQEP